nr:DUF3387 domain-containing protein [Gelidibacter japonicus]
MAILVKLAEFGYPPVMMEAVYKNVLEQAENLRGIREGDCKTALR